jgi:hypothetical protein
MVWDLLDRLAVLEREWILLAYPMQIAQSFGKSLDGKMWRTQVCDPVELQDIYCNRNRWNKGRAWNEALTDKCRSNGGLRVAMEDGDLFILRSC